MGGETRISRRLLTGANDVGDAGTINRAGQGPDCLLKRGENGKGQEERRSKKRMKTCSGRQCEERGSTSADPGGREGKDRSAIKGGLSKGEENGTCR